MLWLYAAALAFGMAGSVYIGRATARPSIRVLSGGVSGAGVGAVLENGAGYSFLASAYYGGMGWAGYLLVASVLILLSVLVANLAMTEGRSGVA